MSSPATLHALPNELKARIALLAFLQDEAFRLRVENMSQAFVNGVIETGWHGRSLNALALVSHEWNELASPHLFKELWGSRSLDPAFQFTVLPSRGRHFRRLVLDDNAFDDLGNSYLAHLTLISPLLPNVSDLRLSGTFLEHLHYLMNPIPDGPPQVDHLALNSFRRYIQSTTSARINPLPSDFTGTRNNLFPLVLLPNLRTLELWGFSPLSVWDDEVAESIRSLPHLEHLKLDFAKILPNPTSIFNGGCLSSGWTPSVRKLDVHAVTLTDGLWSLVPFFAERLESLDLHVECDTPGTVISPQSFPLLSSLHIHASSETIAVLLPSFTLSPLTDVDLSFQSGMLAINLEAVFPSSPSIVYRPQTIVRPVPGVQIIPTRLYVDPGKVSANAQHHPAQLERWCEDAKDMLHSALVVVEGHHVNGDVVGAASLARALNRLRAFATLEMD